MSTFVEFMEEKPCFLDGVVESLARPTSAGRKGGGEPANFKMTLWISLAGPSETPRSVTLEDSIFE